MNVQVSLLLAAFAILANAIAGAILMFKVFELESRIRKIERNHDEN